jgi:hypothetical protein
MNFSRNKATRDDENEDEEQQKLEQRRKRFQMKNESHNESYSKRSPSNLDSNTVLSIFIKQLRIFDFYGSLFIDTGIGRN